MPRVDTSFRPLRARHRMENVRALSSVFERMQADVAARHDAGLKERVASRWAGELAAVILDRNRATATEVALRVVKAARPKRADDDEYDPDVMLPWLSAGADRAGQGIVDRVDSMLDEADDSEDDDAAADPVNHTFGILLGSAVALMAQSMVTTSANFATKEAAGYVADQLDEPSNPDEPGSGGSALKTWQVNSGNPRSSHASMDGETVSMSETFSNGMQWPGDPDGGADEVAGCQCSLTIVV